MIWCAGTQHIRPLDLAGLAMGLLVLGVVDVLGQPTSSSSQVPDSTEHQLNGGASTRPLPEASATVQY
jgi:hypothetical protein